MGESKAPILRGKLLNETVPSARPILRGKLLDEGMPSMPSSETTEALPGDGKLRGSLIDAVKRGERMSHLEILRGAIVPGTFRIETDKVEGGGLGIISVQRTKDNEAKRTDITELFTPGSCVRIDQYGRKAAEQTIRCVVPREGKEPIVRLYRSDGSPAYNQPISLFNGSIGSDGRRWLLSVPEE